MKKVLISSQDLLHINFKNQKQQRLWLWLLLNASQSVEGEVVKAKNGKSFNEYKIRKGQLIFNGTIASKDLNIDVRNIYRSLKYLEKKEFLKTEMSVNVSVNVSVNNSKQNLLVTIYNFDSYMQNSDVVENDVCQSMCQSMCQSKQKSSVQTKMFEENFVDNSKKKQNGNQHMFKNSKYYDFKLFKKAMMEYANGKYAMADFDYYYNAVLNWSNGGKKKTDWISQAANFMLKDMSNNSFRKTPIKNFYEEELMLTSGKKYFGLYERLINFIFGKNPLGKKLDNVLKFDIPLKYEHFEILLKKINSKNYKGKKITDYLLIIENRKNSYNNYSDLFLSLKSFIEKN